MGGNHVKETGLPDRSSLGRNEATGKAKTTSSGRGGDIDIRIEELTGELERKEEEIETLTSKCKRFKEDFDNYRERMKRDGTGREKRIRREMILELLAVIDVLEAAGNFKDERTTVWRNAKIINDIRRNIAATYNKLVSILELVPIDPSPGEMFDGGLHRALDTAGSAHHIENSIVKVVRRGYLFDGEILRPAEVVISKPTGKPTAIEEGKKSLYQGIRARLRSLFSRNRR